MVNDINDNDVKVITNGLKAIFDAMIEFEKLPVVYTKTCDGWAGYRGNRRITRFRFSEEAAREEVIAQDARHIEVK